MLSRDKADDDDNVPHHAYDCWKTNPHPHISLSCSPALLLPLTVCRRFVVPIVPSDRGNIGVELAVEKVDWVGSEKEQWDPRARVVHEMLDRVPLMHHVIRIAHNYQHIQKYNSTKCIQESSSPPPSRNLGTKLPH